MEENKNLNLSAPWETQKKRINALFREDPDITVICEERNVQLLVRNPVKADALARLIPTEYKYGNETLTVEIVPGNDPETAASLFQCAFNDNPILSYVEPLENVPGRPYDAYVVFRNEVAQFFNDDLSDVNGNWSGLYEDLAREVFDPDAGSGTVSFCTDVPGDLGKPLGEWP